MRTPSLSRAFIAAVTIVLIGPAGVASPRLPVPVVSAARAEPLEDTQRSFIVSVRETLAQKRFGDLDKTADELLRTKSRFAGGDWKLYRFHGAVGRPGGGDGDLSDRSILSGANALLRPGGGDVGSDETWERHIALLRLWRTDRPKSAVAALALGDALVGYAWKARGAGYADTVTGGGERVFQERLRQAVAVLAESKRLSANNPQWYCVMIDLARGQGWKPPQVDALFEEAVALQPLYLHVYSAKARYLLPRWYGDNGDWERFAEATAARVGGREGSVIYGHIVWQVSAADGAGKFFAQNHVSWVVVKQAFRDREAAYGASARTLNGFCLLAGSANDKATARELFVRIGDAWDSEVWQERQYFDAYRKWAFKE